MFEASEALHHTAVWNIFSYLWGISHGSFRNYGSNAAIYNFFEPEINRGDFRPYFELFKKSWGATTQKYQKQMLKPWYLLNGSAPIYHTDPVCEFFSENYLMAKLLQNNSNLNDLEYSRHLKVRKIEKKAKKFFEGQTKARGLKIQIFITFWTF